MPTSADIDLDLLHTLALFFCLLIVSIYLIVRTSFVRSAFRFWYVFMGFITGVLAISYVVQILDLVDSRLLILVVRRPALLVMAVMVIVLLETIEPCIAAIEESSPAEIADPAAEKEHGFC